MYNHKGEVPLTILKIVQALIGYLELEGVCEHARVVEHHHTGHIDGAHSARCTTTKVTFGVSDPY